MTTVVLLSGGLDSTVCLAIARKTRPASDVLAVSFDYGQRHRIELIRAFEIAQFYQVRHKIIPINVGFDSSLTGQGDVETDGDLSRGHLPSTWVPGRNLLFLSWAVAEAGPTGQVYIGVNQLDFGGYPKLGGLELAAHYLTSADSMAWSLAARPRQNKPGLRLQGCTHTTCSNCAKWARLWAYRIDEALGRNNYNQHSDVVMRGDHQQGDLFTGAL